MSEIDDTAIDTVTKKYRAQYGFNFKIDATPGMPPSNPSFGRS
jgi:hypothetical protein